MNEHLSGHSLFLASHLPQSQLAIPGTEKWEQESGFTEHSYIFGDIILWSLPCQPICSPLAPIQMKLSCFVRKEPLRVKQNFLGFSVLMGLLTTENVLQRVSMLTASGSLKIPFCGLTETQGPACSPGLLFFDYTWWLNSAIIHLTPKSTTSFWDKWHQTIILAPASSCKTPTFSECPPCPHSYEIIVYNLYHRFARLKIILQLRELDALRILKSLLRSTQLVDDGAKTEPRRSGYLGMHSTLSGVDSVLEWTCKCKSSELANAKATNTDLGEEPKAWNI